MNTEKPLYWQIFLTKMMFYITQCRFRWFTWSFIKVYCYLYAVKLEEAERPIISQYKTIQDFFTRHLNPNARQLPDNANIIVSPVDGTLFDYGQLNEHQSLQAKGKGFSLLELLGNNQDLAQTFVGGKYFGLYLAPGDYHRVHMPFPGSLVQSIDIPGKLHSVKVKNINKMPKLFANNERRVFVFESDLGTFAVVMVGALIVRGIQAAWENTCLPISQNISNNQHESMPFSLGAELGLFNFGSTVIVLFANNKINFDQNICVGSSIKLFQSISKPIQQP